MTDAEWHAHYEGGGESRRSNSGRHRSSHHSSSRSSHHTQQQQQQHMPQQLTAAQQQYMQQQQQLQQQQQQQQQQQRGRQYHSSPMGGSSRPTSGRPRQAAEPYAPTTGQMRSGHIEVDTLYSGGAGGGMTVNSMNAPNNSTMQCGCENIDCPFCNQMMSIQMSS